MLIIGAPVHYFFTPLLGDFTQNGAGVATLLKMGGDFTQNGTHGQATLLKMGRSGRASAVSHPSTGRHKSHSDPQSIPPKK